MNKLISRNKPQISRNLQISSQRIQSNFLEAKFSMGEQRQKTIRKTMHDQNENINIEIETIKEENQTEILALNTTITEWKTLLETFKQKQELEKR